MHRKLHKSITNFYLLALGTNRPCLFVLLFFHLSTVYVMFCVFVKKCEMPLAGNKKNHKTIGWPWVVWEAEIVGLGQRAYYHTFYSVHMVNYSNSVNHNKVQVLLYFDLRPDPKMLFQGDAPEGSDTFQWPVIEWDRVGELRLITWDKVKVPRCHYSDAPEESDLWTPWQLFPLDDD